MNQGGTTGYSRPWSNGSKVFLFVKKYPNITVELEAITDYAETALLRLPTEDWGDVMFIPTVDAADLPTYFLPYGTVEDPFRPAELCFGARGHFFARAVATDAPGTIEILKAAYNHKGASVCEIMQDCVIFNHGTHDGIYDKAGRAKNAIYVKHGQPLVFGENNEFGLVQEGFGLKIVEIGKDGITIDDILVHDAKCQDNTLQLKLALMGDGDGFPIALGVIRDVEAPTYNDAVEAQIEEVKAQKKYHNFAELLETNDIWEVK